MNFNDSGLQQRFLPAVTFSNQHWLKEVRLQTSQFCIGDLKTGAGGWSGHGQVNAIGSQWLTGSNRKSADKGRPLSARKRWGFPPVICCFRPVKTSKKQQNISKPVPLTSVSHSESIFPVSGEWTRMFLQDGSRLFLASSEDTQLAWFLPILLSEWAPWACFIF